MHVRAQVRGHGLKTLTSLPIGKPHQRVVGLSKPPRDHSSRARDPSSYILTSTLWKMYRDTLPILNLLVRKATAFPGAIESSAQARCPNPEVTRWVLGGMLASREELHGACRGAGRSGKFRKAGLLARTTDLEYRTLHSASRLRTMISPEYALAHLLDIYHASVMGQIDL